MLLLETSTTKAMSDNEFCSTSSLELFSRTILIGARLVMFFSNATEKSVLDVEKGLGLLLKLQHAKIIPDLLGKFDVEHLYI